ncbi:MAG TPA: aldehyde dehydrogenase family protein [Acidimicrobiales bacterium]
MASTQETRRVVGEDATTFESLNPATGEVVGTFPIDREVAVRFAVERARGASEWWRSIGFDGRAQHLTAYRAELARRMDELADLIHRENGKPHADAVLEITLVIDHLSWAASHARRVLAPRPVFPGLMALNNSATVEYQPLGVIGVIGPWNYPVFTPAGSIAYALAAGNAVIFKPSEYTPAIGKWLVDAWATAVPRGRDLFALVTGLGDTGAALCRSGVDKIAFTGSARTGRRVMAACAENLVPVLMECGGKDALIVDDGADLDAAADAALWSGMSNGGQTCIGTERVYATEAVYDRFVSLLTEKAGKLQPGSGDHADWGPPTMPSQMEVIRRHVGDAIKAGGRAVVGGVDTVKANGVDPTILVGVPEDSAAVAEETFGPTLTVAKVRDAEEALTLVNASSYGLGGSVFTQSRQRGIDLARRMRAGMVSVNSVLTFAFVPGLPFGGVGESGFGRIHGPDGLREFSRAKSITAQRFALPMNLTSFNRPAKATDVLAKVMKLVYGRRH